MSQRYEFNHQIPGLTIMLGVLAVVGGAILPWLEAKGPKATIYIVEAQPQQSISGFDKGAEGLLVTIFVVAAFALLIAVALMATHRRRGFVWRLCAVLCGLSACALGAVFIAAAHQTGSDLGVFASAGLASARPGTGAYLLAFGGLVILIGAIMPGRRALAVAPVAA